MNGAMLLPEFDVEAAQTRKTLERVPAEHFAWRPHAKSYTLGELATHLAEVVHWLPVSLDRELLDLDQDAPERLVPTSAAELVDYFDRGVVAARKALEGASEELLQESWSLKVGGQVVLTMPKAAVVRSFVLSHGIHHRAQLGVYLRLLDVPVPAVYGPSADEAG